VPWKTVEKGIPHPVIAGIPAPKSLLMPRDGRTGFIHSLPESADRDSSKNKKRNRTFMHTIHAMGHIP
jgi:hypothetical protein